MITKQFDRNTAREALESLSQGVAPSLEITRHISVGLDFDLQVIEDEYFGLDGLLRHSDQGTFKLIEAYYGGGKTHYLRSVEELAHKNGFASAFIELSKDSCPLTRFDLVYQRIAEHLCIPDPSNSGKMINGIGDIIRAWVIPKDEDEDPVAAASKTVELQLGDLPIPSMRIALERAALAVASHDRQSLDEILVYLHSGKIALPLRKIGILEPIDVKNGVLAIRSLATWLRQIGFPGLLLVMDEGDRSLSLSSGKDRASASNNLVQLINETLGGSHWPGVMFLYSIPSWNDFHRALGAENQALEQRVKGTGFPAVPPAPRIVLDERLKTDEAKVDFCVEVGARIVEVFMSAYPLPELEEEKTKRLAREVATAVLKAVVEVHFRRRFVQSYVSALYKVRAGDTLSTTDIENLVDEFAG